MYPRQQKYVTSKDVIMSEKLQLTAALCNEI